MYKPIIETLTPSSIISGINNLQLWDQHHVKNEEPLYRWNLIFKDDGISLVKPVVIPAKGDWQMALTVKGITKTNRLKKFDVNQDFQGTFMILKEIR